MSDTMPVVSWAVGAKDGSPSGQFSPSWWGDHTLEEMLRETIEKTGLGDTVHAVFPLTTSLWHTFWMDSPLSQEQIVLLHDLFSALDKRPDFSGYELSDFLSGLDEARKHRAPVYVELSPPGHSDLGWFTIFPHCPRCKAEAPLPRWQESYPRERMDCPICGTSYSPADTYSSEREYYTDTVRCSSCQREYPIRMFSDEERELLEDHHTYREFVEELRMLKRVDKFYKRHPDMEGKIVPHFEEVMRSEDPRVREQVAAGKPFDQIELPEDDLLTAWNHGPWSEEDEEVVDYLRHNLMSLHPRMSFVSERIEALRPAIEQRYVKCPHCQGKVE